MHFKLFELCIFAPIISIWTYLSTSETLDDDDKTVIILLVSLFQ